MRTETSYYCEICGKRHWEEEAALACEEAHKVTNRKPKYNKGDLLHYVDPEDGMDVYFTFEDNLDVYWDAEYKCWIYNHCRNNMPEDYIELVMTAEEYNKRIDDIKAKLAPCCHGISVLVDTTQPKFFISAYWNTAESAVEDE